MTASKVEKLRQKHDYLMGYDVYWFHRDKELHNDFWKYKRQEEEEKGYVYAQGTEPRLRRRREWINKLKLRAGCIDCGYKEHAEALHFDHRDRTIKNKNVSQIIGCKLNKIFEEIRKCDVRCANCHAVKTVREKETVPLIPRLGWKILEEDKIRLIEAFWLWMGGASAFMITKKTGLTYFKVSQLLTQWSLQKSRDRQLALKDPEGLHLWDKHTWQVTKLSDMPDKDYIKKLMFDPQESFSVTGNRLMRRATNKEYFIRKYGEAAL